MNEYMRHLEGLFTKGDSLKLVKAEAAKFHSEHSADECFATGCELYRSDSFQIQEVGVFLMGLAAHENADAMLFLKEKVSRHENWKVQEALAMAFDNHCRLIGYEAALPVIEEWLNSECANVRRAATEGLRVWTSRPYFKENPQRAISLLSAHRGDESAYVRRSIGNALKDIGKTHGDLLAAALDTWDLSSKEVRQVYKLASRYTGKGA